MLKIRSYFIKYELYSLLPAALLLLVFPLTHIALFTKAFWGFDFTVLVQTLKYLFVFLLLFGFLLDLITRNFVTNKNLYLLCALILNILFVISIHLVKIGTVNSDIVINIKVITSLVSYFLIGYYLSFDLLYKYKWILFFVFAITLCLDFSRGNYDAFRLNRSLLVNKEMWSLYIQWADTVALFSLVLLGLFKQALIRLPLILGTILSLFVLNSRAALYTYVLSVIIWLGISFGRKAILGILAIVMTMAFTLFILKLNPRMIENGGNLLKGNSMNARSVMLQAGIDDIKENPITGLFLGQYEVKPYKSFGAYIHNYLSFYRQFGIFAFLIIIYFFMSVLRDIIWKKQSLELIPYVIMSVILSIFFRAYLYPYFWISFGAWYKVSINSSIASSRHF